MSTAFGSASAALLKFSHCRNHDPGFEKGRNAMGRPPVPPNLKVLRGTTRPDRPAANAPIGAFDELPDPPSWLPALGVIEYARLGKVLTANGLLHAGNVGLLVLAAAVHAKLAQEMMAGLPLTAALVARYQSLLAELGASVVARLPSAVPKPNRFSHYGRRPGGES